MFERIVREFGGCVALDCRIIRGGRIRVGDAVELAERDALPSDEVWSRYGSDKTRNRLRAASALTS